MFLFGNQNYRCRLCAGKFQSLIHQVSVSFDELIYDLQHPGSVRFNPLFIRSVFLLNNKMNRYEQHKLFQSLIHQVSVSFRVSDPDVSLVERLVSIPYSSGQCFFYKELVKFLEEFTVKFQSLIHQVSVSFDMIFSNILSLLERFQSLIHQVSVSFQETKTQTMEVPGYVSIPYSSGQCFF